MADPTPIVTALDRAGYRLTEPRRALAALIADQDGHFTAAELVAAARDRRLGVGRATVFRTLEVLEELGAVERLDLPSASTPTSAASPLTITTSSARAAAGPTEIDDAGLRRSSARSPARPATGSTTTGSSCSGCARPAWPPGPVPTSDHGLTDSHDQRGHRPCIAAPVSRLGLSPTAVVLVAVAVIVAACGSSGGSASPVAATLKVVATTTVFADIVRNVGGDRGHGQLDHPGRRRARGLRAQAG